MRTQTQKLCLSQRPTEGECLKPDFIELGIAFTFGYVMKEATDDEDLEEATVTSEMHKV